MVGGSGGSAVRWWRPDSLLSAEILILGTIALVAGVITVGYAFLNVPEEAVVISDIGRDLVASALVESGENPYQRIVDISEDLRPARISQLDPDGTWIAHSPFSLAFVRLVSLVFGAANVEGLAAGAQMVAMAGLVVALFSKLGIWGGIYSGMILLSAGAISETFWLQGASGVALGLVVVYALVERHRVIAITLLGVMIAWRPWLSPLALFVPGSRSSVVDATRAAVTAVAATLVVLPFVGGLSALFTWLTEALPANLRYFEAFLWNLSIGGYLFPFGVSSLVLIATVISGAVLRTRIPESLWPSLGAVLILAFAPLVWSHYWLSLTPCLWPLARIRKEIFPLFMFAMAWPFSTPDNIARASSYLGVTTIALFLVLSSISRGANNQSERASAKIGRKTGPL